MKEDTLGVGCSYKTTSSSTACAISPYNLQDGSRKRSKARMTVPTHGVVVSVDVRYREKGHERGTCTCTLDRRKAMSSEFAFDLGSHDRGKDEALRGWDEIMK